MSKPNPFYTSEKEHAELLARRDTFKFSEPESAPKLVVVIAGREGTGKTHLACTMSELEPVYLIDTEYRAQMVTRKFKNVRFAVVKDFLEMAVAVKHILKHQPPGTIVIDSGSDLQTFAEIAYLDRTKMEKVYPVFNWSEVWGMCNAIIDDVKFSQRFNLVITARVKEEYVADKATGQVVPRLYSTLPYKADVVLQFSPDKERKLVVTKNGFTGSTAGSLDHTRGLPQIIKQLSSPAPAPSTPVPPKTNGRLLKVAA
jgi:hypothetical protein